MNALWSYAQACYFCLIFSGAISVAEDLDREKIQDYNLIIIAKDGGNKVSTVD